MADLADGESTEMKGSGAKPYVLKNVGGVYSCSCPAWRNQSNAIERRTCKHLRKLRGDEAEKERVGGELPQRAKASGAKEDAPPLLLAQSWDNAADLTGWWLSEKLDGVRAYWDGKRFLSRLGNEFLAPDWFLDGLPDSPLDGELWIDRGAFQKTVSIVRRQDKSDHWKKVRYVVFDSPGHSGAFEDRIDHLEELLGTASLAHVTALEHNPCNGTEHLAAELARVEGLGGEGLMLREPKSMYEVGRSWTLLKVKTFHDAEAIVIDHVAGKGKHKGRTGALVVKLPDGTEFSVGTGLSDRERESPPEVGRVIMFRYQEMSDGGVPRFPSYVREADDEKATAVLKEDGAKKVSKKKAAKSPPAQPAGSGGQARYFELVDGNSSKFWEVQQDGAEVTVRYGRIGTEGTSKPKSFADETAAEKHCEKLISQKTGKGYEEK